MENTLENLSDSEQIHHPSPTDHDDLAENRRYTFIQRQVTPLLTAISMIELPTSEEDEDENSEDENSEDEDSADEDSEADNNRTKRATICSETDNNRTKGATICSETDKNRTKRATICSETDQTTNKTRDNQSWEELTRQEDEYFEELEKEIQEKEEESKQ